MTSEQQVPSQRLQLEWQDEVHDPCRKHVACSLVIAITDHTRRAQNPTPEVCGAKCRAAMPTAMGTGAGQSRHLPRTEILRGSPPASLLAQLPGEEGLFASEFSTGSDPSTHHNCATIPSTFACPSLNCLWLQSQPPGVFLAEQIIQHSPARLMQVLVLRPGVCAAFTLISPETRPFYATEDNLQSGLPCRFSSWFSQR